MSNQSPLPGAVCRFPALQSEGNDVEPTTKHSQVSIELPTADFQSWAHGFSRDQKIPVSSIFIAIWSLMLKTFTGNDEICTGVVFQNSQLDAVTTVVEEQATVIELLRSIAIGTGSIKDSMAELPFNTAVYFASKREEISRDRKDVSRSLIL